MSDITPITCPNCGGQINFPKGMPRVQCPYCGTDHILTGETARQVQMEGLAVCPVCKKDDRLEKVSAIVVKESAIYPSKLAELLTLSQPYTESIPKPTPPAWPDSEPEIASSSNSNTAPNESMVHLNVALGIVLSPCLLFTFLLLSYDLSNRDYLNIALFIGFLIALVLFINLAFSNQAGRKRIQVVLISLFLGLFGVAIIVLQIYTSNFNLFSTGLSLFLLFMAARYLTQNSSVLLSRPKGRKEKPQPHLQEWNRQMESYRRDMVRYEKRMAANQDKEKRQAQRIEIWNELYYCHRDDCVCLPRLGLYAEAKDMESLVNAQWWQRYGAKG